MGLREGDHETMRVAQIFSLILAVWWMASGSGLHPEARADEPARTVSRKSAPAAQDAGWPGECQSLKVFFDGATVLGPDDSPPPSHQRCKLGKEQVDVFVARDEYCDKPHCQEKEAYCLVGRDAGGRTFLLFDQLVPLSDERAPWDPPLFDCEGGQLYFQRSREDDLLIPLVRSPFLDRLIPSPGFLATVNALLARDVATPEHALKLKKLSRGLAEFAPDLSRRLEIRAAEILASHQEQRRGRKAREQSGKTGPAGLKK